MEKLQRMTPDKNAPLAVFLCSDAAKGVTGQVFGTRMHEIDPVQFAAPGPHRASGRGLDAGKHRRGRHAGVADRVHAAGYVGDAVQLGSAVGLPKKPIKKVLGWLCRQHKASHHLQQPRRISASNLQSRRHRA